jgi:hypothetical protein
MAQSETGSITLAFELTRLLNLNTDSLLNEFYRHLRNSVLVLSTRRDRRGLLLMLEIIDKEREAIVDLITKHDFLEMEEFNARTN